MCWTREGVPPQPERARGRFSTLNASAGHEPHNALVGMSMRWVVLKSRVATGRGLEVECEDVFGLGHKLASASNAFATPGVASCSVYLNCFTVRNQAIVY